MCDIAVSIKTLLHGLFTDNPRKFSVKCLGIPDNKHGSPLLCVPRPPPATLSPLQGKHLYSNHSGQSVTGRKIGQMNNQSTDNQREREPRFYLKGIMHE